MVALVVTGHRDLSDVAVAIVQKGIEEFMGYRDHDEILFGGARGADTVALIAALQLRGAEKWPKLIVVVPDTVPMQPRDTQRWAREADTVIELKRLVTVSDQYLALRRRNQFMIDWAAPDGRVLAFWNRQPSGTSTVIRYAATQLVTVCVREIPVEA